MDKEKTILNYMEKLGIDRAEAEQLFQDEQEDWQSEEMKEMEKKAKEVSRTIHDAHTFDPKKPKVERKRAENVEKQQIINELFETVIQFADTGEITNKEKYISFKIGENDYEINLICKRKPKKTK